MNGSCCFMSWNMPTTRGITKLKMKKSMPTPITVMNAGYARAAEILPRNRTCSSRKSASRSRVISSVPLVSPAETMLM